MENSSRDGRGMTCHFQLLECDCPVAVVRLRYEKLSDHMTELVECNSDACQFAGERFSL